MSQPGDAHAKEMEELLQALWKKNYSILQERLQVIRDAQERLATGSLDEQARSEAESAAHKLAGILGTFGLPEGSALASKIEGFLARRAAPRADSAPQLKSWLDELEVIVASRN